MPSITWPNVLLTRLLRCYYHKNNWLYGHNSWEKNGSNVCFLFLLLLFREILKTQLLKFRISSSPVQVMLLSLKITTCELLVMYLAIQPLGWAVPCPKALHTWLNSHMAVKNFSWPPAQTHKISTWVNAVGERLSKSNRMDHVLKYIP